MSYFHTTSDTPEILKLVLYREKNEKNCINVDHIILQTTWDSQVFASMLRERNINSLSS